MGLAAADGAAGEELIAAFRARLGDDWADLPVTAYRRCRGEWGYLIPAGEAERHELAAFCRRVIEFQNHFLEADRRFLLAEVGHPSPPRRRLALDALRKGVFDDDTARAALRGDAEAAGDSGEFTLNGCEV